MCFKVSSMPYQFYSILMLYSAEKKATMPTTVAIATFQATEGVRNASDALERNDRVHVLLLLPCVRQAVIAMRPISAY